MSKQPVTPQVAGGGGGGGGGDPPRGARGVHAAPSQPGTGRIRYATVQSNGAGTGAADGGDPPSGARGAHAAPSQPGTGRIRYATAQSDGAGTRAADGDRPARRHVTYMEGHFEAAAEQPPSYHDDAGGTSRPQASTQRPGPGKPIYIPMSQRRRAPAADEPQPQVYGQYTRGRGQEDTPAPTPARRGGRAWLGGATTSHSAAAGAGQLPQGTGSSIPKPGTAAPPPAGGIPAVSSEEATPAVQPGRPRGGLKTAKTIERISTMPNEQEPSSGGAAAEAPLLPRGRGRGGGPLETNKTIERVPTLETNGLAMIPGRGGGPAAQPQAREETQRSHLESDQPPQHQQPEGAYAYVPRKKTGASPSLLDRREKKAKKPLAICFTLCCILFWLLVVCLGLAILVVYLLYHPKPPRLHISTATLNAGYIDELPPPHMGKALNSDLYVLAAIYNPNTKLDVVLRYMQLDLYFQGRLIGTQAVWPPLYQKPGDSALRSVHLVVSEVVLTDEDAELWKNATTSGQLVEMHLQGKFHVQLNFGRWLPFRYTVRPICALWLDPPPAGALRRARCVTR